MAILSAQAPGYVCAQSDAAQKVSSPRSGLAVVMGELWPFIIRFKRAAKSGEAKED